MNAAFTPAAFSLDNASATLQTEKMAALGRLMAGVAHELNTPIGAVAASSLNVAEAMGSLLGYLPQLFGALDAALAPLFFEAVQKAYQPARLLSTMEQRRLVRRLEGELEAMNAPDPENTALTLAQVGLAEEAQRFAPLFCSPHYKIFLDFLFQIKEIRQNIWNANVGAEKTKKIVAALKNYAREDNALQNIDVQQNLETILTLYHNQIKYGVELELDFAPGLVVRASGDALGQVWTNLMQNALYAMNSQGKLSVGSRKTGNMAEVWVQDSGGGIPAEIQDRIFDTRFTTKPGEEGNGLGLGICRSIVEELGGTIRFESAPGQTTFYVTLPLVN